MTQWLSDLHTSNPVAHAIALLSLVALSGMALGSLKFRGIGLGVAGVLFTGIVVGHFGQTIDHQVLDFTKDLGLILFVFTIGLQLGPGFFSSLRRQGSTLNLLALAIVLLGACTVVVMAHLFGLDRCLVPGLLAGATTNTPSLAAGQQALAGLSQISDERAALAALAYAVAYPIGIVGVIGSMLLLKSMFRIDIRHETNVATAARHAGRRPLERRTLVITNPAFNDATVREIPVRTDPGVIISRVRHVKDAQVVVATDTTQVHIGDELLAVGQADALERLQTAIGEAVNADLRDVPGQVISRRVLLTNRRALGKTVPELGLDESFGVVVSRIMRSDVEMTAVPDLRLQFGDLLQIVGTNDALEKAAVSLGNSVKALNETHFVPLFAGIFTGVLLGSIPIAVPGLPTPLRLGLAGGPLIVAIIVGRIGHFGPFVWHMPTNANLAFRELGIALFLASVGLTAGSQFFEMAFSPAGAKWLICAICTSMVPLMLVGILARTWLKLDFVTISGLLAGGTTDPPALAFANAIVGSDAPSISYATVYPLTMVLRVLVAQILVLVLLS